MNPTLTWTFDRATGSQALTLPGSYTVALCGTSSGNPPEIRWVRTLAMWERR